MEYKIHCAAGETVLYRELDSIVGSHLPQLEKVVSKFSSRSLLVSLSYQRTPRLFELKLSLVLDSHPLSVTAESPFLESVIALGFRKLFRQVRIFKEMLRHTRTYERVRVLKESNPSPREIETFAAELEKKVREKDFIGFQNRLTNLLPRLEKFLKRELHFHEAGSSVKNRAELVRDIVEEALLNTYEKFQDRPPGFAPEKWIFRHAAELLGRHIANAHEEMLENEWSAGQTVQNHISEEEREHEEWVEELEALPLELIDFDTVSTFSNGMDEEEPDQPKKHSLSYSLNRLPKKERKALFLCFLDGFRPAEAAVVLNCSEPQVRILIERGSQKLRRFLATHSSYPSFY